MNSSHEKARGDLWGEPMDVKEAVGRLHVMNSSHELHVMNSSHEWHVMNSSHEKAPEDLWGEPMDVVKGRVGLLVTLPLPWVGGSCDGGDEGEETLQSLPRWVMAWGESA
jgi:hypothetical protein